jgi:hypothetical protein
MRVRVAKNGESIAHDRSICAQFLSVHSRCHMEHDGAGRARGAVG